MKKTLTYLLCAMALLAILSGCGDSDDGKVTPKPTNDIVDTNSPVVSPDPTIMPTVSPNVSSSPENSGGLGGSASPAPTQSADPARNVKR